MARGEKGITRESVLGELNELIEGRHPACQTLIGRFIRDEGFQQASEILARAIEVNQRSRSASYILPPPGWLLPA